MEKEKYKVTIIIPVYNVKEYLKECIDSIISLKGIEIIIIDDGSNDGSEQICNYYQENKKNVKVIHKKNEGPAVARNIGLRMATGKYIAFLDSDDKVKTQELQKVINNICKKQDEEDVLLGEKFTIIFPRKTTKEVESKMNLLHADRGTNILEKFLPNSMLSMNYVWLNMYSRKFIIENNIFFDEDVHLGEDTDWLIKVILKANRVNVIENSYYIYRGNRRGSIVTEKTKEAVYGYFKMVERWNDKKMQENSNLEIKIKTFFSEGFFMNLKYIYGYEKNVRNSFINEIENAKFLKYPNSKKSKKIAKNIKTIGIKNTLRILNFKYRVFKNVKNFCIKIKLIDR